jgi:hypothetical protein
VAGSVAENEHGPIPDWLGLQAALVDAGTGGVALGPGRRVEHEEATVESDIRALEGGERCGLLAAFERRAIGVAQRAAESRRPG